MTIVATKSMPLQRVMNRLLDNIQDRLRDCRQRWWETNGTACLINQWALVSADGKVELLSKRTAGAKQIADANYEPTTGHLLVSFQDGTATKVMP